MEYAVTPAVITAVARINKIRMERLDIGQDYTFLQKVTCQIVHERLSCAARPSGRE
jgi:hypothetical protein